MENVFGLDAMTALILTGLVMGGAELIKRLFDKDWRAAAIIVSSAVIGGLAGMSLGITVLQGIAFGLPASGYITLAQNIGKKAMEQYNTTADGTFCADGVPEVKIFFDLPTGLILSSSGLLLWYNYK